MSPVYSATVNFMCRCPVQSWLTFRLKRLILHIQLRLNCLMQCLTFGTTAEIPILCLYHFALYIHFLCPSELQPNITCTRVHCKVVLLHPLCFVALTHLYLHPQWSIEFLTFSSEIFCRNGCQEALSCSWHCVCFYIYAYIHPNDQIINQNFVMNHRRWCCLEMLLVNEKAQSKIWLRMRQLAVVRVEFGSFVQKSAYSSPKGIM